MECQNVSKSSLNFVEKWVDLPQNLICYSFKEIDTSKTAVQPTDGVSNLAQQSNAQPKQADNDDISSFTDEAAEEKAHAQSNNAVVNSNAVP